MGMGHNQQSKAWQDEHPTSSTILVMLWIAKKTKARTDLQLYLSTVHHRLGFAIEISINPAIEIFIIDTLYHKLATTGMSIPAIETSIIAYYRYN